MELLKTLIIEDDSNIQRLYKKCLKKEIFETRFASDGKAGLDIYKEWGPDLILLDMNLPIMSGFQILKLIREEINDQTTCIIVQTSKNSKEDIIDCAKFGIQGYIVKPFSPLKIVDTILNYYSHCEPEKAKEIQTRIEQMHHGGKGIKKCVPNRPEETESTDGFNLYLQKDGTTENQRKLLKLLRKKLGITEERGFEIEDHLIKMTDQYTSNEFEYMGVLKFCFEEGPENEEPGKILDRQREKFEIIKECTAKLGEKTSK
ncbi:MAG: response regulator [Desulfobacteraceae bacterium]|nr:response regulator [Desulfobacteraceae bacterium]